MTKKTITFQVPTDSSMGHIPVTFDPVAAFGKIRAPVRVTIGGHTYRSTIASMGEGPFVPLRKSNREAAGVRGGETVRVVLELDEETRTVVPPRDLVKALKATPPAWDRWAELSYSHQREYAESVEGAKQAETRARRIAKAVEAIAARAPKAKAVSSKATSKATSKARKRPLR